MDHASPHPHDSSYTLALVEALKNHARALPQDARGLATQLELYASEIQDKQSSDEALVRFERFAFNFKGLRDYMVSGRTEAEWLIVVNELRGLARSASLDRGLDNSFLGRLHRLLFSLRNR